jgi:hypothetical protein
MTEDISGDTNRPSEKRDPFGLAYRQVGAIFGAFGFLSLLKDLLEWQRNIRVWLDAFRAFTRPIASFLFGWIPALIHLPFPGWAKDYLTVGTITALATMRGFGSLDRLRKAHEESKDSPANLALGYLILVVVASIVLLFMATVGWVVMFYTLLLYFTNRLGPAGNRSMRVFLSVYIYAAAIIVINYVFIAAGARTG